MWHAPLLPFIAAVILICGLVSVGASLSGDGPLPPIAPPPLSTNYSVTPGYSYRVERSLPPSIAPLGTPSAQWWHWRRHDLPSGCAPELMLSRLCMAPTATYHGYDGK